MYTTYKCKPTNLLCTPSFWKSRKLSYGSIIYFYFLSFTFTLVSWLVDICFAFFFVFSVFWPECPDNVYTTCSTNVSVILIKTYFISILYTFDNNFCFFEHRNEKYTFKYIWIIHRIHHDYIPHLELAICSWANFYWKGLKISAKVLEKTCR